MKRLILIFSIAVLASPALMASPDASREVAVSAPALTPTLRTTSITWSATAGGACSGEITGVIGRVVRVVFVNGTRTPTTAYDVTLKDQYGFDVLSGQGANVNSSGNVDKEVVSLGIESVGLLQLDITNAGDRKNGILVVITRP